MSSSSEVSDAVEDLVQDEPMYYVLGQYLETPEGKNIARVLDDLTKEIRAMRELFAKALQQLTPQS